MDKFFSRRKVEAVTAPASSTAGATFGPWANHGPRCSCNVCK